MLTIIQGHASLQLSAENLNDDVTNSLQQMSLAAERAAALTRQLLMFSRKQVVQPRVLDLNVIVGEMREMLSRLIGEHISLNCELSVGLPTVFADQSNLEQIVMNLAANARDAMMEGGELLICTDTVKIDAAHVKLNPQARTGSFVCMSVVDTGCGMSLETLSHMFEPFFTTKEVGKGTGIGLATVYGILAQHEGWIEVESQVGKGSSFNLYLPVSEQPMELSEEVENTGALGGEETILVVEDEPGVRSVMTHVLRHHGYNVLEASDSIEAMDVWSAEEGDVDLLVTDIVMPNGIKGNALADCLRAEKSDLKVIFSSGYSPDFCTEGAPQSHRINFLEKPYKPGVLIRAVRNCLDA